MNAAFIGLSGAFGHLACFGAALGRYLLHGVTKGVAAPGFVGIDVSMIDCHCLLWKLEYPAPGCKYASRGMKFRLARVRCIGKRGLIKPLEQLSEPERQSIVSSNVGSLGAHTGWDYDSLNTHTIFAAATSSDGCWRLTMYYLRSPFSLSPACYR